MPAHIGFADRVQQFKMTAQGKLGFGKWGSFKGRGYTLRDFAALIEEYTRARECAVADYPTFRAFLDFWNPHRSSWSRSAAPAGEDYAARAKALYEAYLGPDGLSEEYFAKVDALMRRQNMRGVLGAHRGSPGAASSPVKPKFTSLPDGTNVAPTSREEWDLYLARGTPTDRMVQALFEKNPGILVMFIRKPLERRAELKRIEVGDGHRWDIIWSTKT